MHVSGGLRVGSPPGLSLEGEDMVNPLVELPVYAGVWMDDPAWVNGGVGTAPESLRVAGSIGTTTATQGTPAARGTLTTSALLGGRRVLDLDGLDDCYPLTTGVSLDQPFEVWWIGTLDTVSGSRCLVGLNSASTSRFAGMSAANQYVHLGSALTGSSTLSANQPYAHLYVANGASSAVYANGALGGSGDIGANGMDQLVLGASRSAPSTYTNFHNGKTALLLTLPTASITQAHRTAMGLWAARFYSVPSFAGAFG